MSDILKDAALGAQPVEKLVVGRPKLFPAESIFGLLTRVAKGNAVPKLLYVARKVGLNVPQTWFTDDEVLRIAAYTGRDFHALRAVAPKGSLGEVTQLLGHELPGDVVYPAGRRVCPKCLQDEAYYRVLWDLRILPTCPAHKAWLVTHCPNRTCKKPLDWRTGQVNTCTCGYDLRRAPTVGAGQDDVHAVAVISDLLMGSPPNSLPRLLRGVPLRVVIAMLAEISGFDPDVRRQLLARTGNPDLLHRFADLPSLNSLLTNKYASEFGRQFSAALAILGIEPDHLEEALTEIIQIPDSYMSGPLERMLRTLEEARCGERQLSGILKRVIACRRETLRIPRSTL